jgi:hypothetical protein
MHPNEPLSPAGGHRLPGFMDYQGMGLKSQFPVERKWALGLQVKFLGILGVSNGVGSYESISSMSEGGLIV